MKKPYACTLCLLWGHYSRMTTGHHVHYELTDEWGERYLREDLPTPICDSCHFYVTLHNDVYLRMLRVRRGYAGRLNDEHRWATWRIATAVPDREKLMGVGLGWEKWMDTRGAQLVDLIFAFFHWYDGNGHGRLFVDSLKNVIKLMWSIEKFGTTTAPNGSEWLQAHTSDDSMTELSTFQQGVLIVAETLSEILVEQSALPATNKWQLLTQ